MKGRKIISVILVLMLCMSMAPAVTAYVPNENAGFDPTFGGEYASAFDLRDQGFVTPVKKQNPWNGC